MPANFSSIVGKDRGAGIPKYCATIVRNRYHNGHPDLLPAGRFPGDSVQYAHEGIEIKASRYPRGWQGHNADAIWLVLFVFDCNGPRDPDLGVAPKPFRFVMVVGAQLVESDWTAAGRSATSRRTPTVSVNTLGYQKMMANWIYKAP